MVHPEGPYFRLARQIALGVPALLLAGAYVGEYGFDLFPCEMCWWQRWPHFAAVGFGLLGSFLPPRRMWVAFAGVAILVSAAIGLFHAGVEWKWWESPLPCSATGPVGGLSAFETAMQGSIVRCDEAAFRFLGVSLAGWNFVISAIAGIAVLALLGRKEKA